MRRVLARAALLAAGAGLPVPTAAVAATFRVTNTNDSGTGSLRWAIEQANVTPGPDLILVNEVGQVVLTYRPLSELPVIQADTELLGGCCIAGPQTVVIDGSQMSGAGYAGLRLGHRVTVAGVVVSGFRDGAGGAAGIRMLGMNSELRDVYVGTNAAGTAANGNDTGVVITGSGNRVGYSFEDDRRRVIVSGNGVGVAILSAGGASGNVIQQAWIGLGAGGAALPNTSHGVRIAGGTNTRLGGANPVLRPIIAFNAGSGIVIEGTGDVGNSALNARIHGNGGLAIDLGGDGVTPNDADDADEGPNGRQNFPVLETVAWNDRRADVSGTLSTRPLQTYRIDFFATATPDPSGHGEADRFLGSTSVITDATGSAPFSLPLYGIDADVRFVSALATDAAGNTSELAAVVETSGNPPATAMLDVNATDDVGGDWCTPSHCSLREAIVAANLTPNAAQPTAVGFDIPGSGPHVITLASSLPEFIEPVLVDGYTQPGAAPNTNPFGSGLNTLLKVTVACNPNNSGGMTFTSDSVVRGLAFLHCGLAIDLLGDRNVVEGNFVGTDAQGGGSNQSGAGIYARGSFNRIGGTTPEARNLVSGTAFGINILPCFCGTGNAVGNVVQGNLVGTTPDGHGALGNFLAGISVEGYLGRAAVNTVIGGLEPGAGNVISGQSCPTSGALCRGIEILSITGPATGTLVQGNYIGTDVEGDGALPNKAGVVISDAGSTGNVVGGGEAGARNVISGNTEAGVVLQFDTVGNRVERNLIGPAANGPGILGNGFAGILVDGTSNVIWSNTVRGSGEVGIAIYDGIANQLWRNSVAGSGVLGIDLRLDGVTPNDPQDADSGPNGLLNFPAVTAAAPGATVSGTMQGAPSRELMLEFFASAAAHPSGYGEGARLLGSRTVVTDAGGGASFTFEFTAPLAAGESVSATATDAFGNTSEFGPARPVIEPSFRGTELAVGAGANGVMDPGEEVAVSPTWRNTSGAAMTLAGQATALGGPAGVQYTLLDAQAAYGIIASGAESGCIATGDCYRVKIDLPGPRPGAHLDARLDERLSSGTTRAWALHLGGSFGDVPPSSPYYRFVETLLHRGVTGGCGGDAYCASSSTSRQELAVFVLTALEGAGFRPLPCAAGFEAFTDVPASSPYCRWIQELSRRRVVSGCGPRLYCPSSAVSREQMAVFVLATREDAGYRPAACVSGSELFTDVPAASPFCPWIEELARRGVVGGCASGVYCPAALVSREQMAVFLAVTFALRLYGP